MKLVDIIQEVLKYRSKGFRRKTVDITIANGNILLRSFHIYDVDLKNQLLKGLTAQEEYAHVREGRDPVYCFIKLDEIRELNVPELGYEFEKALSAVNM